MFVLVASKQRSFPTSLHSVMMDYLLFIFEALCLKIIYTELIAFSNGFTYPYIVGLKYEKSAILPNCLPQIMKSILFESRVKVEFQKTFIFCL